MVSQPAIRSPGQPRTLTIAEVGGAVNRSLPVWTTARSVVSGAVWGRLMPTDSILETIRENRW